MPRQRDWQSGDSRALLVDSLSLRTEESSQTRVPLTAFLPTDVNCPAPRYWRTAGLNRTSGGFASSRFRRPVNNHLSFVCDFHLVCTRIRKRGFGVSANWVLSFCLSFLIEEGAGKMNSFNSPRSAPGGSSSQGACSEAERLNSMASARGCACAWCSRGRTSCLYSDFKTTEASNRH